MKLKVVVFAAGLLCCCGCAKLVHWYAGTNDLPTKSTLPAPVPTNTASWPVYHRRAERWTNLGMLHVVYRGMVWPQTNPTVSVWQYSLTSGELLGVKPLSDFTNPLPNLEGSAPPWKN